MAIWTIWISGTPHNIYQVGYALQSSGFHILNEIIWYKPNAPPNLACRCFAHAHETIIWAKKSKDAHQYFNYKLMKEGDWQNDFLKKPNMQMRSVWAIQPPKNGEKKFGKHPTQKPIDLLARIILASTEQGDWVLDPFTGSSTTGLAAYLNKRKYIGIDLEKKYLDLSIQRFEDLSKNKLLWKSSLAQSLSKT